MPAAQTPTQQKDPIQDFIDLRAICSDYLKEQQNYGLTEAIRLLNAPTGVLPQFTTSTQVVLFLQGVAATVVDFYPILVKSGKETGDKKVETNEKGGTVAGKLTSEELVKNSSTVIGRVLNDPSVKALVSSPSDPFGSFLRAVGDLLRSIGFSTDVGKTDAELLASKISGFFKSQATEVSTNSAPQPTVS